VVGDRLGIASRPIAFGQGDVVDIGVTTMR
jgi:hypothetical protein